MSWTVPVAMYGWLPLMVIAFSILTPSRAVLVAYIAGWLFLPDATIDVPGFPDYGKATAISVVVALCVAAFDGRRLLRFQPRLVDVPMAAFCLGPLFSSLSNDLGWYDALSSFNGQVMTWGLPYLMGRLYFTSREGLRDLALGIMLGGLVYVPLCLYEIRMSPQLHVNVYGFMQHSWQQTMRGGGYRPMVFMHHGLMVGLWMTSASLVAFALLNSGAVRKFLGLPQWAIVAVIVTTTVLCKSFGALLLLAVGATSLLLMRYLRVSLPMALLVCLPGTYVGARIVGGWSGEEVITTAGEIDTQRQESLAFRIEAEALLLEKALDKPLFGWGGWGRSFITEQEAQGRQSALTVDSLWIILFGKNGTFGLVSVLLVFLVPLLVLWQHCPPRLWATQHWATVAWALGMVLTLYAIDSLVNNMENPVYLLIAGGLSGLPRATYGAGRRAIAARVVRAPLPRAGWR